MRIPFRRPARDPLEPLESSSASRRAAHLATVTPGEAEEMGAFRDEVEFEDLGLEPEPVDPGPREIASQAGDLAGDLGHVPN